MDTFGDEKNAKQCYAAIDSLCDMLARFIEDGSVTGKASCWLRDEIEKVRTAATELNVETRRYRQLAKDADDANGGVTVLVGLDTAKMKHPRDYRVVVTCAHDEVEAGMDGKVAEALQAGMEAAFMTYIDAGLTDEDGALAAKNIELLRTVEKIKAAVAEAV